MLNQKDKSSRGTLRLLTVCAGVMGAAGVVLAALAAHQPEASRLDVSRLDVSRLDAASSMLLFHATAVIGTVLLTDRGLAHRHAGVLAAAGFVAGAGLFGGDLALRQFAGHGLFPMAAPTGGTLLIASWLMLAFAAAWPRQTPSPPAG